MTPGPEMDVVVAEKVMGWRRVSTDLNRWMVPGAPAISNCPDTVPHYSTDDACALKVVDKVLEKPYLQFGLGWTEQSWVAQFQTRFRLKGGSDTWTGCAPTRAEAICRAALAVMEGK